MVFLPLPKDERSDITNITDWFAKMIMHRILGILNDDASDDFAIELDSHAESPAVGRYAKILEKKGRKFPCQVSRMTWVSQLWSR